MKILALAAFLFLVSLDNVASSSCLCKKHQCKAPACCPTGVYVKDHCGCCLVCPKAAGEKCGSGPMGMSFDGVCTKGATCERIGGAENPKEIFPGGKNFKGMEFYKQQFGEQRCVASRPQYPLIHLRNGTKIGEVASSKTSDFEREYFPAPVCQANTLKNKCRCSSDPPKSDLGELLGCTPDHAIRFIKIKICSYFRDLHPRTEKQRKFYEQSILRDMFNWSNGLCSLENVKDPTNPKQDCYEDVEWSAANGRFWSSQACHPAPEVFDQLLAEGCPQEQRRRKFAAPKLIL